MKDPEPMGTVVVSLAPDDPVPLLLLGITDEFTGRPWRRPARHWPGSPLIGGLGALEDRDIKHTTIWTLTGDRELWSVRVHRCP